MRVGITVNFSASIFSSGISQNAIYLANVYQEIGWESVLLTNQESEKSAAVSEMESVGLDIKSMPLVDSIDKHFDVVISLGLTISNEIANRFRDTNPNVKFVAYKCGNEFFTLTETVLFGAHQNHQRSTTIPFDDVKPDQIWSIPQMENTNLHFYQYTQRGQRNATVVPFIWSPITIEKFQQTQGYGNWSKRDTKRIAVCEANINVQKHMLYPIITASRYLEDGHQLDLLNLYSTNRFQENKDLIGFIRSGHKDLLSKVKVYGRRVITTILAEESDLILSWQMENNLNYLYLDAAWLGYPVVHNANLCQDVGYYYESNDAEQAVDQLVNAFENHNEDYLEAQRSIISRYTKKNPQLLEDYKNLTIDLVNGKFSRKKYDWKTNSISDR